MKNLEPKNVFAHFLKISEIPRGSGNEKAVSDFIAAFARECGADVSQDAWDNLIIKKAASAGFESRAPVILQAHMDMVCEKNAGTTHDFTRDALDLYVDGDFLRARGTTLGADNGIGVAFCMAFLDGDYAHPPLEILLTTDEETGMSGAENLDISGLCGTRMINLDSSDETTFTMGCAAGTNTDFLIPAEWTASADFAACEIRVTGLKGGHSGGDIEKERGNALRILGLSLSALSDAAEIHIAEISGGMKVNAIPREAAATVVFPRADESKICAALEVCKKNFAEQFRASDAGLKIERAEKNAPQRVLTRDCTQKVIAALLLIPNGALSMSLEIAGLPVASNNIGVAETTEAHVKLSAMPRGAARFYTEQIEAQINALAVRLSAKVIFNQRSPAWPYNPESALLNAAQEVYRKIFGKAAAATAVHGGLECGIFSEKFAARGTQLDIISFGPNAHDYHTPDEHLSISSTARVWGFLVELLSKI